jgi:hypothetical protein
MARDAEGPRDVDSAGVYFMSVEEFEARSSPKRRGESAGAAFDSMFELDSASDSRRAESSDDDAST